MHILGLANGSTGGNSEILLKAALTAAQKFDSTISTSWIHVPSVSMPLGLEPLKGLQDVSLGNISLMQGASGTNGVQEAHDPRPDDRQAVLNAVLDADALIFSTPVYSHQPAGTLKAVIDRIMGPFADAAFATRALEKKRAGDPAFVNQHIDERLLKPRVVGFIAVGGSTTGDQFTMALSTLHLFVYCLHAKVVDQCVIMACGAPGSVLKNDAGAVKRAQRVGRNVASEIGKTFDAAKFLGDEPEGACPYCHLAKFELLQSDEKNAVGCVTCGARGKLTVGDDGVMLPMWNADCDVSSITMKGKLAHVDDIVRNGKAERKAMEVDLEFEVKQKYWTEVNVAEVTLPSKSHNLSSRAAATSFTNIFLSPLTKLQASLDHPDVATNKQAAARVSALGVGGAKKAQRKVSRGLTPEDHHQSHYKSIEMHTDSLGSEPRISGRIQQHRQPNPAENESIEIEYEKKRPLGRKTWPDRPSGTNEKIDDPIKARKCLTNSFPRKYRTSHIAEQGIGDAVLFNAASKYIAKLEEEKSSLRGTSERFQHRQDSLKWKTSQMANEILELKSKLKDKTASINAAKAALSG